MPYTSSNCRAINSLPESVHLSDFWIDAAEKTNDELGHGSGADDLPVGGDHDSAGTRPTMKCAWIAIGLTATLAATPAQANFRFCSAISASPRGSGLIVTAPFEARERDVAAVRRSFIAFLRYGIAPYGNSWIFDDTTANCVTLPTRGEAERQRAYLIGRSSGEGRNVYPVAFTG